MPLMAGTLADDLRGPPGFELRLRVRLHLISEAARPRAQGVLLRLLMRLLRAVAALSLVVLDLSADGAR